VINRILSEVFTQRRRLQANRDAKAQREEKGEEFYHGVARRILSDYFTQRRGDAKARREEKGFNFLIIDDTAIYGVVCY